MELIQMHPRPLLMHDVESTNSRHTHSSDRPSMFSRNSSVRQTNFSNSWDFSDTETSSTPLYRDSVSSFSNESNRDSEIYYNNFAIRGSRIQNRALPLVPPDQQLPANSNSSSGSTYETYAYSDATHPEKHSSLIKSRSLFLLTIFAVAFSALSFGTTLFVLLTRVLPEWESGTFNEGDYQTCVACVELPDEGGNSGDLKGQLTRKMVGSETMCCAKTSGQMSALMQLIIKQRTSVNVTADGKQKPTFSPVSAHKCLQPWSADDVKEPTFLRRRYHLKLSQTQESSIEHVRHVTAKNNSFQIQYPGWYFVYSGVNFRPATNKPCNSLRRQIWGHFINKQSPQRRATSGVLIQTAHTCCDNCTEDHHTSYTGGVFLLQTGDSLFVDVSGSGLVNYDGKGSYFGLVMLGSWDPSSSIEHDDSDTHTNDK